MHDISINNLFYETVIIILQQKNCYHYLNAMMQHTFSNIIQRSLNNNNIAILSFETR